MVVPKFSSPKCSFSADVPLFLPKKINQLEFLLACFASPRDNTVRKTTRIKVGRKWLELLKEASMAKTWDNVPCRFWTKNTVNNRGNSEYRVFTNRMIRHAPVNVDREGAKDQVFTFERRAICYLDPGSQLFRLIMRTPNDKKIKIDSVAGDDIWVKVRGVTRAASRRPEVGLATFDFVNNNGDLSGIHVGHEIDKLVAL